MEKQPPPAPSTKLTNRWRYSTAVQAARVLNQIARTPDRGPTLPVEPAVRPVPAGALVED
ncbi:hypothetical protein BH09ACT12_BH09ACT12_36140 [soil metagenome]